MIIVSTQKEVEKGLRDKLNEQEKKKKVKKMQKERERNEEVTVKRGTRR